MSNWMSEWPHYLQRLVVIVIGRANVADHERARVAAQRVLQDARELGIAIGHVGAFAVRQFGDDLWARTTKNTD